MSRGIPAEKIVLGKMPSATGEWRQRAECWSCCRDDNRGSWVQWDRRNRTTVSGYANVELSLSVKIVDKEHYRTSAGHI